MAKEIRVKITAVVDIYTESSPQQVAEAIIDYGMNGMADTHKINVKGEQVGIAEEDIVHCTNCGCGG